MSTAASPGNATIKVLLADDQALVRSGFKSLLDAEEEPHVDGSTVGEWRSERDNA